ncbi:hypothetical protein YC2023_085114 [Brassica napus]
MGYAHEESSDQCLIWSEEHVLNLQQLEGNNGEGREEETNLDDVESVFTESEVSRIYSVSDLHELFYFSFSSPLE